MTRKLLIGFSRETDCDLFKTPLRISCGIIKETYKNSGTSEEKTGHYWLCVTALEFKNKCDLGLKKADFSGSGIDINLEEAELGHGYTQRTLQVNIKGSVRHRQYSSGNVSF
jgi:hypothetical protein